MPEPEQRFAVGRVTRVRAAGRASRCRSGRRPSLTRGLALAAVLGALVAQAAHAQAPPRTHAERTEWAELTPHTEVVRFYHELSARTPDARLAEIGRSREGRPILALTLARPAVAEPWEAHASGKPVVYIGAQVHGDEQAGKEGLMLFARDLAFGALRGLLDDVVFVLVPQQNPDGGEAGTWGTRANRAGYNINRDYVLLTNPETRAIVEGVLVPWRPHVIIDAHELTGPRWYDFYALHPSNLNGPSAPRALAGGPATDAVRAAIEGAGHTYFPYHLQPSDPTRVPRDGILAAEYGVRTLRSYGGARNAVTLLFESRRDNDARVGIEARAGWQRAAMEGVARWVAGNAADVLAAVADGRAEMARLGARWDPADSIVVAVEFASSGRVPYRMPEMRRRTDGGFEATGAVLDLEVEMHDRAVPTLSRVRPLGYLIEPHRSDLAAHLRAHGLQVERYDTAVEVDVESYRLESVRRDDATYEGYIPRTVTTATVPRTITVPAGAYLVRATQPMAVLAFAMLEPEDVDSFASAGWFAAEKSVGAFLPVHRVRALPAATPLLLPDRAR
jgi:hypothetical protein